MPPLAGAAAIWRALDRLHPGWVAAASSDPLGESFSAAPRTLGKQPVVLQEEEEAALASVGIEPREPWGIDELGRVALLLQPELTPEAIEQCFFRGDNRERQAVLKALPLLPDQERFIALAVEACRTSVEDVFRAIACDNPFPSRHFPPGSFNQMVLKSIFNGVPVSRIVGLAARVTPELLRMADDYAAERRAAGRKVPDDIALLHALSQKGAS